MNNRIKNWLMALLITLPISFTMVFFGFLPLRFDAVLYTDNIVGEGTCQSYLTDTAAPFSYLYKGEAYFGSELKTLRLFSLPYNVKSVEVIMYDVEEADIIAYDISLFNRTISHISKDPITHPFTVTTRTAVESVGEPIVHLVKPDGEDSMSISFPGNSLIPNFVWIAYGGFIFLIGAALALLAVAILERAPGLRQPLMSASAIVTTMIMGCFLCGSLPYVDYTYFLLNWLLLFATALLINSLTVPWLGTVLVSIFTLVWYIADHFVILFRNKPIMPADLKAIGTAKEVAGGYNLAPTWQIIISVLVVLFYLTVLIVVYKKTKPQENAPLKKSLILRGSGAVVAVVLVFIGTHNTAFSRLNTFQWDAKVLEGFHREGIVLTYIRSAMSAHVSKPEGYSREAVDTFLKEYQEVSQETKEGVRPTRIIMVMNEAFSDLRTVGLNSAIDVMPYIDSLTDNTIQGNLYVSVIGGGTCNTEFEALTGNTLAFLGSGAYPYTENVTEPLFSLAQYFKENGFFTEAFHANEADNWNRSMVYPNLGFEEFHSIEDYPELDYIHNYVTDLSDYHYIISEDKAHEDAPRFLFNVTIQNHSDYDHFIDVIEAETIKENGSDLAEQARVYLSLVKLSDNAVKELVETYESSNEPTMIIFFGDHQPHLGQEAFDQTHGNTYSQMDLFKTKFFIWTNYESASSIGTDISANYLPWLILERGNFSLPPYVQMLHELYENYPILTSQGVLSMEEGILYESVADIIDDPLIRKYQYIQYANLFDEIDPAWFEVNGDS